MQKIIMIFLLTSTLFSASFSARYTVNVSMFGKVGYIDLNLNEKFNKYTIKMVAKTTGTAAKLTGDRLETYVSKGTIVDSKYIPELFIKVKKTNRKTRTQTYTFNHDEKTITLVEEKEKLISSTEFNPMSFKIEQKESIKKTKNTKIMDKYVPDDVLSSFMNTTNHLNKQHSYKLEAIGAHNDKKDVNLYLLNDSQKEKVASDFSKNIAHVCNLNVKPHDSDDKTVDILIGFDNNGNMKEAVLGDIFWIGKITATRLYYKSNCD